jgi:uncharacterized protein
MPFKAFKTKPDFYYVYDMNTNSIYKITHKNYDALCRIESGKVKVGDAEILKEYKKRGILLESPVKKVEHPATLFLEDQLSNCVNSITFQMSQNCNLRCSYCPFSDNSIYNSRSHNSKNITWKIIKKGIDFLVSNSKNADNLHISFYGGEPLLVKDLIIYAMDYARKQINGKIINFGMTTNGTLLDDNFAKAIKGYNMSIIISFDGPKEIHDSNRKFINGKGSFEVICKNVKNLKENYPSIFSKLSFNTVISPNSNFEKVHNFFEMDKDIFNLSNVNFTTLSSNYTDNVFEYGDDYLKERNYKFLNAYLILLGKLKKEFVIEHKEDVEKIFSYKELFIPIKETSCVSHPSGTCIPGLKKLFVDVYGNFFPCERVNEDSSLMKIGNIKYGFNLDKVREVLNIGAITEEICKKCWAFHQCSICPVSADNGKDKHYKKSYKLSKCSRIKENVLENLKNYTLLKEFKFQFNKEDFEL